MNPTRLRLANFRTYNELDLVLPAGAVGIVGANGSGKSSLLVALDVALFGPEGRSLEPYMSEHAVPGDTLSLEVELDHGGDTYRIRRTFTSGGRGKSTLDFALVALGGTTRTWEPLTQGDQKETQALIERTLGLTRETFRASAMLAQGEGGSFAEAQPRERKRILSDALGLHFWDECKTLAAADKRVRELHVQNLDGRLGFLAEQTAQRDEIAETVSMLEDRNVTAEISVREAEAKAEGARSRHAAMQQKSLEAASARDSLAAARAEHAALAREQQAALDARVAAAKLEQELPQLRARANELTALEAERETMDQQWREQQEQRTLRERIEAELRGVGAARGKASDAAQAAIGKADTIKKRLVALHTKSRPTCDRCQQHLPDESRALAVASNERELADVDEQYRRAAAEEKELDQREQILTRQIAALPIPEITEEDWLATIDRLGPLRGARENLAAAAERLAGLQATAAIRETFSDELAAAEKKVRESEQALRDADEPEPGTVQRAAQELTEAVRALDVARAGAESVRVQLATAKARLETLDGYVAEHERARAERDQIAGELAELELLEQAFGRNGVPTWILETSAIPALELEADRLLALLGSDYRVELRTEREKKSGGTSETLDVVLITPSGERDYATFSGGERTRLNLALRLALARLLAHRRGAESGLLAIDEPEFLDTAGTERLVEALRDLQAGGEFETVLLVSHVPALRDAFDTTLAVTKTDGRSEVVVA